MPDDQLGEMGQAFRDLHRSIHALGAALMLELVPAAEFIGVLLTHGRYEVDADKVSRWRRIAEQEADR